MATESKRHPVVAYCHGVLDGSVPACEMIRLAVKRHLADLEHGRERGLHFDRAAAEYAVKYFGLLKHSKGEWAGQVFVPSPWQQFILWNLYGWKRADGLRRFRTVFVEIPRKNGKSAFASGNGLYLMTADGEPGAEIYSAATKRDQAKITWEEAVRMVKASPVLSKMITHWRSSDTLAAESLGAKFVPLGADADTMDGLNLHGAIIDELHAHKTSAVVDVLDTATGARRQPVIFEITTAGFDRESICYQHYTYSRQVLQGTIQDDRWFAYIAELDPGDAWDDERTWAKANPNLGVSVRIDDLRAKAEKAKNMPAALNGFLRLHLNVWTNQSEAWIPLDLWDAQVAADLDDDDLVGRKCYGGLDLSAVSDLTAWVLVFPRDDGGVDVWCRFWCPEAKLEDAQNRFRDQYQAWARGGYLEVTAGNAIDYQVVKARIIEDASRFQVVDVNIDRLFNGYQLSQELQDEGLAILGFAMGPKSFGPPMKTFERLLLEKKINHGGNPMLRWQAGSIAVRHDVNDNLAPDKVQSQGRIDGIVALVMALDRWERNEHQPSSYDNGGLFS